MTTPVPEATCNKGLQVEPLTDEELVVAQKTVAAGLTWSEPERLLATIDYLKAKLRESAMQELSYEGEARANYARAESAEQERDRLREEQDRVRKALGFVPSIEEDDVMVSDDAYENIGGAIIDIAAGDISQADINTLKRVERQLYDASEVLGGPQWFKRASQGKGGVG